MFLKYCVILCLLHSVVALKATEYCPSVKEDQLTWPKTAAGSEVYSEEYCFTDEGLRLSRLCVDDTVNGPHWADVTEDCQIQVVSSIAQDLMRLDAELWNKTIILEVFYDEVINITNKYAQLNAFDVYVTNKVVYRSRQYTTNYHPQETFQIFDNILRTNSNVLEEAQTRMRTTEDWYVTMLDLTSFTRVKNYVDIRASFDVSVTDIAFIYTGAIVEDFGNEKNLSTIGKCLETFDSVLQRENLEVAVWVVPPPADYTDKHTFIFYWNDVNAFFYDKSTPVENIKQVVSVWQNTQHYNISTKRVILRFDENTYDQNIQCASWEEGNETQGSWKITGEFSIQNSCFICTYTLISEAFAFILAPEKTVTESLTELSTSSSSLEILSRLLQYSTRYDEFVAADITLTGQLLKKISTSNDLNLEFLHTMLDNLHNINKTVLGESQTKNKSTDAILYYFDTIIQNNVYTSDLQFIGDNVITLVYNLNNTDFSGVALSNGTVKILEGDVNITQMLSDENLGSAMVLSSELKNQLNKDGKIVVNIFLNDVLFGDKNTDYSFVSKVFGVLIPEISTNYSGPVSIIHKVDTARPQQTCSYWLYDVPQNVAGSWKNDSSNVNVASTLVQCDYWHTTHFSFLQIDDSSSGSLGHASKYHFFVISVWLLWSSSKRLSL